MTSPDDDWWYPDADELAEEASAALARLQQSGRGTLAQKAELLARVAALRERGRASEARAKAICQRCPAKAPCLEYALETGEPYGVWGGATPSERWRMRRGRDA